MALHLDHTIVPAYDKEESARFIARILGLEFNGPWGHFTPVKIDDILTLDFDSRAKVESHHYAFLASDEEFDAILNRVREEDVAYGSSPFSRDGKINHLHQGRGFYFYYANDHSWEIITHTYTDDSSQR